MDHRAAPPHAIAVYGAGGHTGRFILAELARRGRHAVAAGRRRPADFGEQPFRVAPLGDGDALRRAFDGCAAVINAAGPFLDTAAPVIEAALDAGCHYLDVTAEQESARSTLHGYRTAAHGRGLAVIPAAGFFGGLADLLAGALAQDGLPIDAIEVAVALDHWWPTAGTRQTGARNTFTRRVVEDGQLVPLAASAPGCEWAFGGATGTQAMAQVPMSEIVTLAHHLPARRVRSWLAAGALRDLRDPDTPPPAATDPQGRSAQRFTLQVVVEDARGRHRATARGRDIYAVSAPLVVEAAVRLAAAQGRPGTGTLGSAFDPHALLQALAPAHFSLDIEPR